MEEALTHFFNVYKLLFFQWHEEKLAAQLREKLRLHGPEDNRIDHGPDYKTGRRKYYIT